MAKLKNSNEKPTHIGLIKIENEEQRQIFNSIKEDTISFYHLTDIFDMTDYIKGIFRELQKNNSNLVTQKGFEDAMFFLDSCQKVVVANYYLLRPFK